MSYKKRSKRSVKPGRKREKWTDILPRYLTFLTHMRPILRETRRIIIDLDADLLLDTEILDKIREEEESELLYSLRRKKYSPEKEEEKGPKFLVLFKLEKELPLIGVEK